MADDEQKLLEEAKKLPLGERVAHSNWKVRSAAYDDVKSGCERAMSSEDPCLDGYVSIFSKAVADTNAAAADKALDALQAFLGIASEQHAARIVEKTCNNMVNKCLGARPGTVARATAAMMLFVELEQADKVSESLISGFSHKVPKVVNAALEALLGAVRAFGARTVPPQPILKSLPPMFDSKDAKARATTKELVAELARWVGPELVRTMLFEKMRDAMKDDVEKLLQEIGAARAQPERFTRKEMARRAAAEAAAAAKAAEVGNEGEAEADGVVAMEEDAPPEVDAYEFAEPKDILADLKKDWWEQLESKKWSERKASLTQLKDLASYPKVQPGDFGDVNRELKKIIAKDSNVAVAAEAVACVGALSKGLRNAYSSAARNFCPVILEKFKEKNGVMNKNTMDALTLMLKYSFTVQEVQEDFVAALNHANPRVREETLKLLESSLEQETKQTLSKLVPTVLPAVASNADEATPSLREAALKYLVTFAVKFGSVAVLDKVTAKMDDTRKKKLEELVDAARKTSRPGAPVASSRAAAPAPAAAASSGRAAKLMTAPANLSAPPVREPISGPPASRPPSRPKPAAAKAAASGGASKATAAGGGDDDGNVGQGLSKDEAIQQLSDIVGESTVTNLQDALWKTRLEAMEGIVAQAPGLIQHCSVIIQALAYVPGSDERNFQVTAKHFEVIRIMAAEADAFSRKDAFASIGILVEKVSDIKLKNPSFEALFAIAETVGPGFVCIHLHKKAAAHKNPKVLLESINWMNQAIEAFGLPSFNVKNLLDWMKEDLGSAQATIRTAAINLLGTMHRFVGRPLMDLLGGDLKPALLTQIEEACSRNPVESGFTPTRVAKTAVKKAAAAPSKGGSSGGASRADSGPAPTASMDLDSMLPRTDISDQLTSSLMSNLMSANWKERKAALDTLDDILRSAGGRIQPQVGELFSVLKHRMSDSNKNLAIQTLHLVGKLATALGKNIDRVGRCVLMPGLKNMSDSKALVRAAVWDMMEAWAAAASVEPLVSETVDVMTDAKCSADGKKDAVTWMTAQVTAGKTGDCLVDVMKAVSIGSQAKESQVREATSKLVSELIKLYGVGPISQACQQLENSHKKAAMEAITKSTGAAVPSALMTAPAAPMSTRPAASAASSASRPASSGRGVSSSASSKLKTTGARGTTSASNASKLNTGPASLALHTQTDDGPLIMLDSKKEERARRAKFKSAKFEIQPDEAEMLQESLGRLVSPSLRALLFHKDFKKHCEAADLLRDNLGELQENILSCVDLIFRWTVLRIVEANTQSIVAVLALLKAIFDVMIEQELRLTDYEAKVLLPCLVEKCGHNNDRIKADFRDLLKKSCDLFSAAKVFTLVRDGLDSKNNRTKIECADELGQIVDRVGVKVYANPKQHEVLQALARMVSERDGGVRKAVLGAMEVLYSFEGDGVWSYLGRLSEQQKNLIEERFKYVDKQLAKKGMVAGYRKPVEAAPAPTPMDVDVPYAAPANPLHTAPAANGYSSRPQSNGNHIPRPQTSLNPTMLQTGGNISNPMVWSTNLTNGPMHPSELHTAQVTNALHTFASPAAVKLSEDELQEELGRCLHILSGNNINDVVEVMKMLCYQLMEFDRLSPRSLELFISHVDRLVHLLAMKTDMIFSMASACVSSGTPPNSRACKYSLNSLMQIFQNPALGAHVTENSMMELMSVLLLRLLDDKLPKLPEGDALLKALNVLMLKILDNTQRDNAFGALLQLLLTPNPNLVNSPDRATREPRWNDLVVKCLIKLTKALPQTIQTCNINRLLLNIHNFFDKLGQEEIRARGVRDDRPLRMVKTLLHELCKMKGFDIYKYLDSIPQKEPRPIIFPYTDLNLQTLVSSGAIQPNDRARAAAGQAQFPIRSFPIASNGSTASTTSNHSTATAHRHPTSSLQEARNVLASIFKRIGDKTEPDKALTELHFFLLEHPEIDINQYLSAASEQFRMFINKGLTRIRANLANRAEQPAAPPNPHYPPSSIGDLRDRIAARQAAMGQLDGGVNQQSMMDLQERMERMRRMRGEVA